MHLPNFQLAFLRHLPLVEPSRIARRIICRKDTLAVIELYTASHSVKDISSQTIVEVRTYHWLVKTQASHDDWQSKVNFSMHPESYFQAGEGQAYVNSTQRKRTLNFWKMCPYIGCSSVWIINLKFRNNQAPKFLLLHPSAMIYPYLNGLHCTAQSEPTYLP